MDLEHLNTSAIMIYRTKEWLLKLRSFDGLKKYKRVNHIRPVGWIQGQHWCDEMTQAWKRSVVFFLNPPLSISAPKHGYEGRVQPPAALELNILKPNLPALLSFWNWEDEAKNVGSDQNFGILKFFLKGPLLVKDSCNFLCNFLIWWPRGHQGPGAIRVKGKV